MSVDFPVNPPAKFVAVSNVERSIRHVLARDRKQHIRVLLWRRWSGYSPTLRRL